MGFLLYNKLNASHKKYFKTVLKYQLSANYEECRIVERNDTVRYLRLYRREKAEKSVLHTTR